MRVEIMPAGMDALFEFVARVGVMRWTIIDPDVFQA